MKQQHDRLKKEMEGVSEEIEGEGDEENSIEQRENPEPYGMQEDLYDIMKERREQQQYELFVSDLDTDATEDDIKQAFSELGNVTEVTLMISPEAKKNRGFALLRFATTKQAEQAFEKAFKKPPVINGQKCNVKSSQDKGGALFVGNICTTWTKEDLKDKLRQHKVDSFCNIILPEDGNNNGMNRGFACLEFSSRSDAILASMRLLRIEVFFGTDRAAYISFLESYIDHGDKNTVQVVKTVYINKIPASWDEDCVRRLLEKYGKIEKIEFSRNIPTARRQDYCYVSFDTHNAAAACVHSINKEGLGEGDGNATVTGLTAKLSTPLEISERVMKKKKKKTQKKRRHKHRPPRSYDRRAHVPSYPKPSSKSERYYRRQDKQRTSRSRSPRTAYVDDGRGRKFEMLASHKFTRDYRRLDELSPSRSRCRRYRSRTRSSRSRSRSYRFRTRSSRSRSRRYRSRTRSSRSRSRRYRSRTQSSRSRSPIDRTTKRTCRSRSPIDRRRDELPYIIDHLREAVDEQQRKWTRSSRSRSQRYRSRTRNSRSRSPVDHPKKRTCRSRSPIDRTSKRTCRSRSPIDRRRDELPYIDHLREAVDKQQSKCSGRGSMSTPDSQGLYGCQGISYGSGSGSYGRSDGGDYLSRGYDVGGSSHSSKYSDRWVGGSSDM